MSNLVRMVGFIVLLRINFYSKGHLVRGYSRLQYGYRLDRLLINSYMEYSILDCMEECIRTIRCKSLNYYKGTNYCELNYENKTTAPERFVERTAWIYSERQDWTKDLPGSCYGKVCGINEKCRNIGRITSCQISDCGIPITSKMSTESVERWDGIGIERRIHLKCSDEYEQTGNGIFICDKNGNWKKDMVCNGKRLGCFEDNETRFFYPKDFVRLYETNDLSTCTTHCHQSRTQFKYIGLQNGYACLCGNHITFWKRKPDIECSVPCPGNILETCGGQWRNEIFTV